MGNTLSVGTFHILSNPEIYKSFMNELLANWQKLDEPLAYEELEKLPYLVRYIQYPVDCHYQRKLANVPRSRCTTTTCSTSIRYHHWRTQYSRKGNYTHQLQTVVSQLQPLMIARTRIQNLDRWLVPFSRGPRQCIGIKRAPTVPNIYTQRC